MRHHDCHLRKRSFMSQEIRSIGEGALELWNRAVPRYTSYPTAPQFAPLEVAVLLSHLSLLDRKEKPLSLYFHIPFCKTMCLFCGCSVVLNRKPERQNRYLQHLLKEIELLSSRFQIKKKVAQLHLGGGTPTSLTIEEFEQLMEKIKTHFELLLDAEISIEIDPRTVHSDKGEKLRALKRLGFNRVSFGVQDLDPKVQRAVHRDQSEQVTVETFYRAKELGFHGINIDLIYGLPFQTRKSFAITALKLAELKPDRIAFYSYAKVPWLKPHQKAIPEESLPSLEEKFGIYVEARELFMNRGYMPIGMDHFSLATDPLFDAYKAKKLTRNFQGYAVQMAEDMIGFGITSIGFIENAFFQNIKEIASYEEAIQKGKIPMLRGFVLQEDDRMRRWAIQSLMCHFALDKKSFKERFTIDFDTYFVKEKKALISLQKEGLLEEIEEKILPSPLGRLFIRLIAAVFDIYIEKGSYSKAV
jgi:oxygen-independent coproporphyrinogen-3 oxidase